MNELITYEQCMEEARERIKRESETWQPTASTWPWTPAEPLKDGDIVSTEGIFPGEQPVICVIRECHGD